MDNNFVDVFIEDNCYGKTFIIECESKISFEELKKLIKIKKLVDTYYFYFVHKCIIYDDKNKNEIMNLEDGDKIILVNERMDQGFYLREIHRNINLNEDEMTTTPLTGMLKLILLKYISLYIVNINQIKSNEIKKIIFELNHLIKIEQEPEKDIITKLKHNDGNNILAYSNYISLAVNDNDINDLLKIISTNKKNEIIKYWSKLTKYEIFNKPFEVELYKAIEESYFDYSIVDLSLYRLINIKNYIKSMKYCCVCNHCNQFVKYLFHGVQTDPISNKIINGLLYSRKSLYGMGIYFSDILDYISFRSHNNNYNYGKIIPVNNTFSCISAEVNYSKHKEMYIVDDSFYVKTLDHFPTYEELKENYPDKMVEKNGINYAVVDPIKGKLRKKEEILSKENKGKFYGTEYVITEMDQILPLFGLTFKRNEYLVIWRDNHFKGENKFSNFLKDRKLFIYEYAKMNVYFENSIEKALEIIKRKKYNKIILISNIGLDLSGKKFVETARKILGFNVMVLFFSVNQNHFSWLQNFPNALYTSNDGFYKKYILNYNEKGLINLKKEVEDTYKIKLNFDNEFLKFPKFLNDEKIDNIYFREVSPYFKKVVIKNSKNNLILCMGNDRNPGLIFPCFRNEYVKLYFWYVTLIDNEITLFSNDRYLGINTNSKKVVGEEFLKRFKFKQISKNEYLIYYNDKNNVLTVKGNEIIIEKENSNIDSQKFKFIEENEFI